VSKMSEKYPSFFVWIVKELSKELKSFAECMLAGVGKVCHTIMIFHEVVLGGIIGFYIVNAALMGYEDKRVKQHGFTFDDMKQYGAILWCLISGLLVALTRSLYGLVFFLIFWSVIAAYFEYSSQREKFARDNNERKD